MANGKLKTLPYGTYLQILGLYTLARDAYRKSSEAEDAIAQLLGREDRLETDFISESVWGDMSLKEALKREGFVVGVAKKSRR